MIAEPGTRGLLQRSHIVANSPPIYIGKESDRHWEEGKDISLLEFKAIQYKRRGQAQRNAIPDDEHLQRIALGPIPPAAAGRLKKLFYSKDSDQ